MTHPAPHAASLDTAYSVCRGLHRTQHEEQRQETLEDLGADPYVD